MGKYLTDEPDNDASANENDGRIGGGNRKRRPVSSGQSEQEHALLETR